MTPVTVVESPSVPLLYSDIDTDQIIPSRYITSRTEEEFARALFAGRRADPDFVLNRPELAGRSILVAGRNFGCGSSREQAVWAMLAGGFRAVVAPSFGDIFASNSVKNGLLTARITPDEHAAVVAAVEADPDVVLTVDLRECEVSVRGTELRARFDVDPFYRSLLLRGMDELDHLLDLAPRIAEYEVGAALHPVTATRIGMR
ncbi:MAG TPA: 3-isopropylmalate dehydratase small subunit [Pseudonocardiaceae bacterium]|nr:3-isopropylmalate dehydratase small subunit [Pseudonocardiaceae bacterium]